jgi:outer membrane lipoprotein-sorting protein
VPVKIRILILITLILGACGKRVPIFPASGEKLSAAQTSFVTTQIESRQETLRSLKALYYATIEHGKSHERLRYVFLYERPSKLRLELLPTTSTYSLGILIASGENAQFVEPQNGKITNSASVSNLIYDTLRIEAGVPEIIQALCGFLPEKYFTENKKSGNFDLYLLPDGQYHIFSKDMRYNSGLSPAGYFAGKAQFLDKNSRKVIMEVEYSQYQETNGIMIPGDIKILLPRDNVTVNMKLNHIEINSDINPKMFEFFSSRD